jgi:hypothetical protein
MSHRCPGATVAADPANLQRYPEQMDTRSRAARTQAPGAADPVTQCEPQLSGNEESGDKLPLGSLRKDFAMQKGSVETRQQREHTRPNSASLSAPERKPVSAALPDETRQGQASSLRIITAQECNMSTAAKETLR